MPASVRVDRRRAGVDRRRAGAGSSRPALIVEGRTAPPPSAAGSRRPPEGPSRGGRGCVGGGTEERGVDGVWALGRAWRVAGPCHPQGLG